MQNIRPSEHSLIEIRRALARLKLRVAALEEASAGYALSLATASTYLRLETGSDLLTEDGARALLETGLETEVERRLTQENMHSVYTEAGETLVLEDELSGYLPVADTSGITL